MDEKVGFRDNRENTSPGDSVTPPNYYQSTSQTHQATNAPTPASGSGTQQGFANQGYVPQPGFANQGSVPQQGFSNQGYGTQQGFSNQGYVPQQGFSNQGYGIQQGFASQGSVPQQSNNYQQGYQHGYQQGFSQQHGHPPHITNVSAAIVTQPGFPRGQPLPYVPNHKALAAVAIFFCLPFGIYAYMKSSEVNQFLLRGDIEGANRAAKDAHKFSIWALACGIFFIVAIIAFAIIFPIVLVSSGPGPM